MSNFFFIDSYGNATASGNISADGYTINPSNSSVGQVLAYDGYAYVPTTISSGITGTFANDQVLFGNVANSTVQGSSNLTFDGYEFGITHIKGLTSTPVIVGGPGLGDGYTVALTRATDLSGVIKLTNLINTVTPANSSTAATVTFNMPYNVAPKVILTPANSNAANLNTGYQFTVNDMNTSTSEFVISSGSSAAPGFTNIGLGMSVKNDNTSTTTMGWTLGASRPWAWGYGEMMDGIGTGSTSIDSTATATSNGGNNILSWTHVLGTSYGMVVGIAVDSICSVSSVVVSGIGAIAFQSSASTSNGNVSTYFYAYGGGINISGTRTITVTLNTASGTYSGAYSPMAACSISLTNTNANLNNFGGNAKSTGSGTSISKSGVGGNGTSAMIIDIVGVDLGGATLSVAGGQTKQCGLTTSGTGIEYDYIYQILG